MCKEDVRFMRQTQERRHVVAVAITDTLLLPANPNRVSLVLTPPAVNDISYTWDAPAVLGRGITRGPGANPVFLSVQTEGPIVTREWRAIAGVAPVTVEVWEVLWIDDGG